MQIKNICIFTHVKVIKNSPEKIYTLYTLKSLYLPLYYSNNLSPYTQKAPSFEGFITKRYD